ARQCAESASAPENLHCSYLTRTREDYDATASIRQEWRKGLAQGMKRLRPQRRRSPARRRRLAVATMRALSAFLRTRGDRFHRFPYAPRSRFCHLRPFNRFDVLSLVAVTQLLPSLPRGRSCLQRLDEIARRRDAPFVRV